MSARARDEHDAVGADLPGGWYMMWTYGDEWLKADNAVEPEEMC